MFKSINDLKSLRFSGLRLFKVACARPIVPGAETNTGSALNDLGGVHVKEVGRRNPSCGIGSAGVKTSGTAYYNLEAAPLYEEAVRRGEAILTADGALVAYTGQHTGRSPKDKFVVRDGVVDAHVWWDNNKPITPAQFDTLHADFLAHAATRDLFVQDLVGGADPENALPTRVIGLLLSHQTWASTTPSRTTNLSLGDRPVCWPV